MGKFEKQLRKVPLQPLKMDTLTADQPVIEGGLIFEVVTRDRLYHTVDLTRYRDGDAKLGFIGSASLIHSLLPAVRTHIGLQQRTGHGISNWCTKVLSTLFKYITHLQRETGSFPRTSLEFQNSDGLLLKTFVIQLGGSPMNRRKSYTAIHSLLARARGTGAPPLHWPTYEIPSSRDLHADVDPKAVKALYNACKRVLDNADAAQRKGEKWLAEGVDPRTVLFRREERPRRHGGIRNEAWYNHANLAVATRLHIREKITQSNEFDVATSQKLNRHLSPSSISCAGIEWAELAKACAPTPVEVTAAMLVVSMETGWIDSVSGIDLTSEWFTVRRGVDVEHLGKTDSVVIHATRPKTSKPLSAIGQAGSRFRSFQIISRLASRSAFLRDCLKERRALLASVNPSSKAKKEIAEIDRRLRSPWIYYNPKGEGFTAVGISSAIKIRLPLTKLKHLAIASLAPADRNDAELVAAIEALKWSDMRDAFAAHIYAHSGGNIFLVKRALDHNSISVTRHYLRQRRLIHERFEVFRTVMETALSEVSQGRRVDPTILFLVSNYADFGEVDRNRLQDYRTRMGMGCRDPKSPDSHLAPSHPQGALCTVQRCILCRQGIIFRDSYAGLAERHADLVWLRRHSNPTRWLTSTLSWELEAIELVRDRVFPEQSAAFCRLSSERLEQISAGQAYVFDEPEVSGIFA